jgi:CBS domain containing-hemolysin-like protein
VIWLAVAAGLIVAAFGATAGAARITVSRAELTRAVSRRLRGATPSLAWLTQVDTYLTAASATTSLGVLVVGAALPGLAGSGAPRVVVALAILGVPLVLFAAYLVPRWLTQPRAETVADRVIPLLRPWSRVLGLLLPARMATRPTDLRSIWREGAAVGLRADDELFLVGGVMAFSVRPVR